MTADQYSINLPYGATSAPYSEPHPHRGDDRPCPTGTPVVIAGTQIGLTGATGHVTGPHLHIQEWNGGYDKTRKPQNSFQPGTVTNIDPNETQGDGSFGKFITIQTADGWSDTYCHLSEINVQIGQEVGEMTQDEAYAVVSQIYRVATDCDPDGGQADYWAKRIQTNPATAAELASALGGNDYKGDPQFRYKGRHYSEDMTTAKKQAYNEGLAAGGGTGKVLPAGNYIVKGA